MKMAQGSTPNGISVPETTQLTKGMMLSGSVIDWQDNSLVVDKHSTGGVGDKMSLMLHLSWQLVG